MRLFTTSHKRQITGLLAVAFWIALWQLVSVIVGQEIILVSPVSAVRKLIEMMGAAPFYRAVLNSFGRILLGFTLALTGGILLAVLASVSRFARTLLHPPMAAISATPIASFVILALVLIGSRNLSVFISFLMVLPVIYLNVLKGITEADPKLIEMARVFRLGRLKSARAIYAPAALPYLLSACQIGLGMCWKSGLAAEVIGRPKLSVGDALAQAKTFWATDEVFAWTLAIILISVAFERLALMGIRALSRRLAGE